MAKVITRQPSKNKSVTKVSKSRSLDILLDLTGLLIHRETEEIKRTSGELIKNWYKIRSLSKHLLMTATEESNSWCRFFCGRRRQFKMHVNSMNGRELMLMERSFKCLGCALLCNPLDCASYKMRVEAPIGSICGYIRTKFSMFNSCRVLLTIEDSNNMPVFKILTKCFLCRCCPNISKTFDICRVSDNESIGTVIKEWEGHVGDSAKDFHDFSLSFPRDLDACMKATLLGSAFLLDYMFYESVNKTMGRLSSTYA